MRDKERVLSAYQRRIDEVTANIAPERLLVFDVADGWEPLCRFLERPMPNVAFPNINNQQEYRQTFGGSWFQSRADQDTPQGRQPETAFLTSGASDSGRLILPDSANS